MSNYAVNNGLAGTQQANSGTFITVMDIFANTTGLKRIHIYSYLFWPNSAPASTDTNLEFSISRMTSAITTNGTVTTPLALDSAEAACAATVGANFTSEPTTYTATSDLKAGGGNQRATLQWATNDFSQMLHSPATNLSGFGLRTRSVGYTGKVGVAIEFQE